MKHQQLIIRNGKGKYNYLDKVYYKLIRDNIINADEKTYNKWSFYNDIMQYLLDLGNTNYFEEVKYRLTGGENPNVVFLEVLNRLETQSYHVKTLKLTIKYFFEEDYFNNFFE